MCVSSGCRFLLPRCSFEQFDKSRPPAPSIPLSSSTPTKKNIQTQPLSRIANKRKRTPLMTSPANQQNPIPANTTPATTASYASAAGAPKKSTQAPIVATGSHPPAVVGGSSSSQNANDASSSPVNGKPAVTPAVPAVTRSSANLNGSDHSRNSSVTMAANAPNNFVANGGPVGGAKSNIQFGFDSPAMANSTPQSSSAAPIPIPGGGNARVPSPAHSPSPIPQPSASGGRPPSGLQQAGGTMTFGSLGSDGEVSPDLTVPYLHRHF